MTEPASIRNISLVGHSSSSKTTIAESLLFTTGAIIWQSIVEEGHTVGDFLMVFSCYEEMPADLSKRSLPKLGSKKRFSTKQCSELLIIKLELFV